MDKKMTVAGAIFATVGFTLWEILQLFCSQPFALNYVWNRYFFEFFISSLMLIFLGFVLVLMELVVLRQIGWYSGYNGGGFSVDSYIVVTYLAELGS
jgi:hypothetical protein